MSNRNFSYLFSPHILWGNISSQSETVYVTLKCLNVQKKPISQMVLITDILAKKLSNLVNVGPLLTDL